MIGNNSAGSRSILHGKTVDHVLELEVVLADGSLVRFGLRTPAERERLAALATLEGHIHREVPRIVAANRDEVLARFPRILRRVSGYNLDEFMPECREWFDAPLSVAAPAQVEAERYPGRRVQPRAPDLRRGRDAGHRHGGTGASGAAAQGADDRRAALRFAGAFHGLPGDGALLLAVGRGVLRPHDRATWPARAWSIATISISSSATPSR